MRILAEDEKARTPTCAHTGCEEAGEYRCEHCDTWYCSRHAGRAANDRLRGAHRATRQAS